MFGNKVMYAKKNLATERQSRTERSTLIVAVLIVFALMATSCVSVGVGQLSPNASQSVLNMKRSSSGVEEKKPMEIYVDGRQDALTLKNGAQGQLLVMNGLHNISVKIGKYQSQMLTFDCESEVVEFYVSFEGEKKLFVNTIQLNILKTSGGNKSSKNSNGNAPAINITVDNSSSNSSSSAGNSSSNSNAVSGDNNSVNGE